jgi:hypothetical protein
MKGIRIYCLLAAVVLTAYAEENPDIIPQQGRIGIGGVYQSWKTGDDIKITEFSIPLEVYYPMNRRLSFGFFLGQGSANGEVYGTSLKSLSGITDAQVNVNYYLEDKNILLSLGGNLPTGKRELSSGEYMTSVWLSQNFYNYQVPMFGQGFNLSPGFTWAKPVNDKTVLGFGASYQFKGGYLPVEGMTKDEEYKPGNEFLLTGGADYQISEISAASFDLTVTLFGRDKAGDAEIYKAGTKVMAAVQYKQYFNYDLLWLFGRFRSRAKSDLYTPSKTSVKTQRDEFESMATYKKMINKTTFLSYCLEARYFFRTGAILSAYQGGGGVLPEFQVSPKTKLQGRFKILLGKDNNFTSSQSVFGFEIGAGMEYAF